MAQATIIKSSYEPFYFRPLPDQYETIEAGDKNSLFSLFFREYHNRYKYHNSISYKLADPDLHQGYLDWLSDINNYADNGGDTW
jgi:hypothetical protein